MKVSSYYERQTEARGLNSPNDVRKVAHGLFPVYRRLILPWLPENRSARIYEAACGPGIMLLWLTQEGFTAISGTDSSPEQIALAQGLGLPARTADSIADLESLDPGTLDAVIAIDFFEHLPKETFLRFLTTACSRLAPGGRLILRGPNGDSPFVGRNLFNDITHQWAYTTCALNALLRIHGFESVTFADDALVGIQRNYWIKRPITGAANAVLRMIIRLATREDIKCLGPSLYLCARTTHSKA